MDFKPSQINLESSMPHLVGTLDRSECEITAALMIKTMADTGDEWRSVPVMEMAEKVTELSAEAGYWRNLFNNPFMAIDYHSLVNHGYAEWRKNYSELILTGPALEKLEKWVSP